MAKRPSVALRTIMPKNDEGVSQLARPPLRTQALVGMTSALIIALGVLAAYLYGPIVFAKFGLIDDHEILSYFGTSKSVNIVDLPRILRTQTEVGNWGHTERFRPLYYVFRILETAWHGLNPAAWYLTRIVMLAVVVAGLGLTAFRAVNTGVLCRARQLVALAVAAVVGILVLTLPAWSDIVMRLGPSEIYVALGVMLFCLGIGEAWARRERSVGWVLAIVGFVVIVGSKEDGLILLPVLAAIYVLRFPRHRARIPAIVGGVLAIVFGAYVALGFLPSMVKTSDDVYGNGHSIGRVVRELWLNEYFSLAVVAVIVALLCDVCLSREARANPAADRPRLFAFLDRKPRTIIAAACLYVVLAELYFYQSYFSANSFEFGRYGLLTELATAIAVAVAVATLAELVLRRKVVVVSIFAMVIVLGIPPTIEQVSVAFSSYPTRSAAIAQQLRSQYTQIQRGVTDLRRHPKSQVVILVQSAADYEPVVGLTSFLRLEDHITSIFLRPQLPASPVPSDQDIDSQLKDFATNGGWAQNGWRVLPAQDYRSSERTTCFYFGSRPTNTSRCTVIYPIG